MYPNLTLKLRRGWFLLLIKLFYMLVLCRFRNKWITSFKEDTCEVQFLRKAAAASVKSLQSCLTLCNLIDGSPPGSPVPRILQARTLERVAISFSHAWKWSRSVVSDSSRPHGLQLTRLLRPWDFPGKSTGVGCHCLLQRCYDLVIPLLGNPEKTIIQEGICIPVFTAALFTIARTKKQSKYPMTGGWMRRCGAYIQWILLSHIEEWNWAICWEVDGPYFTLPIQKEVRKRKTNIIY